MNELLKKRIEEAADTEMSQYYNDDEYPCGIKDIQSDFKEAFKKGAEYALSYQWISVDEAYPDDDEICLFIDNHGKMQLLTMNDVRKQHEIWEAMFMGIPRDLFEESICRLDKIIAWLPIPKFETKTE